MRGKLAERQAAMKKKLSAARETFRNCAFRPICCEHDPGAEPESCNRCSPEKLQQLLRRTDPSR